MLDAADCNLNGAIGTAIGVYRSTAQRSMQPDGESDGAGAGAGAGAGGGVDDARPQRRGLVLGQFDEGIFQEQTYSGGEDNTSGDDDLVAWRT